MGSHPLAPSVDFLPENVQRLFVRAFTEGAADPGRRPSAAEWRAVLQGLAVRSCGRGHQVPVETEWCPWCRIDDERAARRSSGQQQSAFKAAAPVGSSAVTSLPRPASATGGGGSSRRGGLIAAAVVGLLAVAIATTAIITNLDTTPSASSTTTVIVAPPTRAPSQDQAAPNTSSDSSPPAVITGQSVSQPALGVIVGTCDEGGSCGVKQRTAPYTGDLRPSFVTLQTRETRCFRLRRWGCREPSLE